MKNKGREKIENKEEDKMKEEGKDNEEGDLRGSNRKEEN